MLFEIKTTEKIKQIKITVKVPIINRTFRTMVQLYKTPEKWTYGMTSKCKDGKHILLMDYDDTPLTEIEDEIKELQEFHKLSHAYIFQMDRELSFHVIILDKFTLRKTFEILSSLNIDLAFIYAPKIKGLTKEWILRTHLKGKRKPPKFVKIVMSKHQEKEISTGHKIFLQKFENYATPSLKYKNEDNITDVPIVSYNTSNRV